MKVSKKQRKIKGDMRPVSELEIPADVDLAPHPRAPLTPPARAPSRRRDYGWMFISVIFVFFVIFLKANEEGFEGGGGEESPDLYAALEIPRSASVNEIRSSYKKLAVTLHPDKNPNCKECKEKFAAVALAYETLSHPEKKRIYDSSARAGVELIESDSSISLNADNFSIIGLSQNSLFSWFRSFFTATQSPVKKSSPLWILQVFSDTDSDCRRFSPVWETVASELSTELNFARLNIQTQSSLVNQLPVKVRALPFVLLLGAGGYPAILPLTDLSREGLRKWLQSEIPSSFDSSASGTKPVVTLETANGKASLEHLLVAFNWRNLIDFKLARRDRGPAIFKVEGLSPLPAKNPDSIRKIAKKFILPVNGLSLSQVCDKSTICMAVESSSLEVNQKEESEVEHRSIQGIIPPSDCLDVFGERFVIDLENRKVAKRIRIDISQEILDAPPEEKLHILEDLKFSDLSQDELDKCFPIPTSYFHVFAKVTGLTILLLAILWGGWIFHQKVGLAPLLWFLLGTSAVISIGQPLIRWFSKDSKLD